HASAKLRHVLKRSVSKSSREGTGHLSDQGAVWSEVGRQMYALGAHSETAAMADTYGAYQAQLQEYRARLQYVPEATGLAVAIGGKIASVDLFDRPATCRKVWDRLLSGLVMEALEAKPPQSQPESAEVQGALTALRDAPWQPAPAVGAGEEFRAELDGDRHA